MEHTITRAQPRRLSLLARLGQMRNVRRQRLDLRDMSDRQLRDIGLTRDEAEAEAERPLWDLPTIWLR
ncbi:MAG: DUF1127 domain-containing protein [Paracoccaceae bacterium]